MPNNEQQISIIVLPTSHFCFLSSGILIINVECRMPLDAGYQFRLGFFQLRQFD